ncbi:MAG TPA: hypothetical protein VG245_05915 [Candidatus Dormibacteraeota bacterium]|jgi:hypothetical protein|nr:hypothetical protein [Candidatus Dormibacteraeota bacterium]
MTAPLSPKERIRAVYTVADAPRRTERVTYQLEDTGHPLLRLRPSLRLVDEDGWQSYLYRVEAFSRVTGEKLGIAEELAAPGSPEEFAASSRQFQSPPFRACVERLRADLAARYSDRVLQVPVQH